jgi:hypothetical protein
MSLLRWENRGRGRIEEFYEPIEVEKQRGRSHREILWAL